MAQAAHLALQNHNILPNDFMKMPFWEKAFIVASDIVKAETIKEMTERG